MKKNQFKKAHLFPAFLLVIIFCSNKIYGQWTPAGGIENVQNSNPIYLNGPVGTNPNLGVGVYVGKGLNGVSPGIHWSTAVGVGALSTSAAGGYNTAFGCRALMGNTTGGGNVAVGIDALAGTISSTSNTGTANIAIGTNSLNQNTTGNRNVSVGYNSMLQNATGDDNIAVGMASLGTHTIARNNVAIGYYALTGPVNVADGPLGPHTGTNAFNTAMGDYALYGIVSGSYNVAMGYNALRNIGTGDNNIGIGAGATVTANQSNQLSIQNCIYGTNMGSIGGRVGIGIVPVAYTGGVYSGTTPKLNVGGTLRIGTVNQGPGLNGEYLYIDANNMVARAPLPTVSGGINNGLASAGNIMTSTVNTVVAQAPIINQVVNAVVGGQLTTSVNGIASNAVPIDAPTVNNLANDGVNTLTSTVNGQVSAAPIINQVVNAFQNGQLTTTINGVASTVTIPTGGGTVPTLYSDNGAINPLTTINNNREVNMNGKNIWFRTEQDELNGGKIYIGKNDVTSSAPPQFSGDFKLYVEKGILTERIKVALRESSNWADYVFANDYKLMPLQKVESFIKTNKHLPGIASADDLTKNGLDLGAMQAKQMEKIEELTLYIIDQNKMIEKQNAEIETLKTQVKILLEKTK